jgi:Lrp/AsnC family leucine-responsive transcriptional regulator
VTVALPKKPLTGLTIAVLDDIGMLTFAGFHPNIINLLDDIDLKILHILQLNGRARLADIAEEVELSAPAVMERVKKLESSGVIKGYLALLDAKKLGKDITAFIGVSINHQRDINKFAKHILQYPDVLECHHVTGEESFILKVKSENTASLERLLGDLRSVEGVTRTVTNVVLSTAKENPTVELNGGLAESSTYKKR